MRLIKKNLLWAILLVGVASIAVYFTCSATYGLIWYSRLTKESAVRVTAWEIRPLRWGKYAVAASYELNWKGKNLKRVSQFSNPRCLNHFSADDAVRQMAKKNWKAWVSSNGAISSLEKKFPWNTSFRALISILVLFYFIRVKKTINRC